MAAIICVAGDPLHAAETQCSINFGIGMAFDSEKPHLDLPNSDQDQEYLKLQLQKLQAQLDSLDSETFGPSATTSGIALFKKNVELLKNFEKKLIEIKIMQKEDPNFVTNDDMQAAILQRNDIRDVIARQKTIAGFYKGPSKEYTRVLYEIKDIEAKLAAAGDI